MKVYYNEWDNFAAAWLRELQKTGHLPAGRVDERSITDVEPKDLAGVTQAHFFAGIGGWPLALKFAGWPDDWPVWTGSCPCQPFSVAGKAGGVGDERHLWPAFHRLIAQCHPAVVFGEQTESKDGRYWLAGVRTDLEREGYAVGAADLCAAGVGAPHRRQRLYWVAYAKRGQEHQEQPRSQADEGGRSSDGSGGCGVAGRVAYAKDADRRIGKRGAEEGARPEGERGRGSSSGGVDGRLEYASDSRQQRESRRGASHKPAVTNERPPRVGKPRDPRLEGYAGDGDGGNEPGREQSFQAGSTCEASGTFWSKSSPILCKDRKLRRIPLEPSLFPLAPRVPGRVGLLRGAGGAIVPQVAAQFIRAFIEARPEIV